MEKKKTVLFDPGYAPLAIDSLGAVGYNYYMFSAIQDVKIKRLKFKALSIKLEYHLKMNVSFYMGCLLWASYIQSFDDHEIEGNKLLGETCEEQEYTGEIDFLIDFIENHIGRDFKYFLNKPYELDERYLPILQTYREFLVLNKGFVNCANTNQIVLPKNLKKLDEAQLKLVNETIQKAIAEANLPSLLDSFDILF